MTTGPASPNQTLETPSLHAHAMKNLQFIRKTMECSASFTAVSGAGTAAVGCSALITYLIASRFSAIDTWLFTWLGEALLACCIGITAMSLKARKVDMALFSGPGGRFMLNLFVPIFIGIPLTFVLYQNRQIDLLPGLWLLLYGAGVVTGGMFSVPTVRVMGFCFIATGMLALFLPPHFLNSILAFGFGGLHILFGTIIAWRHGG